MTNEISVGAEGDLIIPMGDFHSNSTLGLCKPVVNLNEGGTYRVSREQRIIWNYFLDFCDIVRDRKAKRKIAILNGDLVEVDFKNYSNQVISRNKATIIKNTIDTLEPLLSVIDYLLVMLGTTAHVGKCGEYEEIIASDLADMVIPPKKTKRSKKKSKWEKEPKYAHEHARIEFEEVRFDIAHHVGMGRLPWTEKNAANKLAAITIFEYRGKKEPHYVLRSHVHKWSDSGHNYDPLTAIILPCWQLKTEFVYRIGKENDNPDIGGALIHCNKGENVWERVLYPIVDQKIFTKF